MEDKETPSIAARTRRSPPVSDTQVFDLLMIRDADREQINLTISKLELTLVYRDVVIRRDIAKVSSILLSTLSNEFVFRFDKEQPPIRMLFAKRYGRVTEILRGLAAAQEQRTLPA